MNAPAVRQASRFEGGYSGICAALFSLAMGLSAVAIPLLALAAGYHAGEVGLLVSLSAVSQLLTRSVMGLLLRHVPDKLFIGAAGLLMASSCLVLVASAGLWAFVLSQLAQGAGRGVFWTGAQTHVVRTSASSVSAIAKVNLTSGLGLIIGPLAAGPMIDHLSPEWTLTCAALCGLLVPLPTALLLRLPPMRPTRTRGASGPVWRRPGVGLASWAGASAGAWRAMMNAYVPVVLNQAGQSASSIGVVAAAANAASIAGGAGAGWTKPPHLRPWLIVGIMTTGTGLALFGALAHQLVAAGAAISAAGIGAGLLQTVGPALASEAVADEERGEAIASTGTYRAAALLVAPLGVAALVSIMTTSAAVAVAGMAMAAPALFSRRRERASAIGSSDTEGAK